MQTGTDERGRRPVLDALRAEAALKETAGRTMTGHTMGESGSGEEFVRRKSALFGLRMALPLALGMWVLIAALIWAWRR